MDTQSQDSQKVNTYLADPEDLKEMARLIRQAQGLTATIPEIFPDDMWQSFRHVLDIGCGPGGWCLEKAARWPSLHLTGIDISVQMLKHARALAMAESIKNVEFLEMDATAGLDFPDASFDFINGRLMYSFLLPKMWPDLLRQCHRVLRPGGHILIFEYEAAYSNSVAFDTLDSFLLKAGFVLGRSFSPSGRSSGASHALKPLLRNAMFRDVSHQAVAFEISPSMPWFDVWRENMFLMMNTFGPYIVQTGITTKEELQMLLDKTLQDMGNPDFCAMSYNFFAWAVK